MSPGIDPILAEEDARARKAEYEPIQHSKPSSAEFLRRWTLELQQHLLTRQYAMSEHHLY